MLHIAVKDLSESTFVISFGFNLCFLFYNFPRDKFVISLFLISSGTSPLHLMVLIRFNFLRHFLGRSLCFSVSEPQVTAGDVYINQLHKFNATLKRNLCLYLEGTSNRTKFRQELRFIVFFTGGLSPGPSTVTVAFR